jgi:hypothetical protein
MKGWCDSEKSVRTSLSFLARSRWCGGLSQKYPILMDIDVLEDDPVLSKPMSYTYNYHTVIMTLLNVCEKAAIDIL